ncbi:MAG: phosphonate C-P lyase system protein PhnG [Roseovarius sp.]|nr:phosphonate C-P lyase system protein PhnG [Roseovarius sp.]MCY4314626.1 phosphonate C-P lyase system protein PhnG [Roseovarius sp.]
MSKQRKEWLSTLAKAKAMDVARLFAGIRHVPEYETLRVPEIGGVMVRGRMGGIGDAFNLGEVTVTRCSVQLETGEVGHGCVQGRNRGHAEQVAVLDAMLQGDRKGDLTKTVIVPLMEIALAEKETRAKKAAATKVDFFTLARGED